MTFLFWFFFFVFVFFGKQILPSNASPNFGSVATCGLGPNSANNNTNTTIGITFCWYLLYMNRINCINRLVSPEAFINCAVRPQ
ncbi:hypothetical protein F4859DRAFT_487902 [Xylaria cf. heliscus]|nr:hypothetical protein F4859DRAFT_487902 [Xylaria cf. heliscus]